MTHVFSSMYLAGLLLLSAATASAATFNAQILDQQVPAGHYTATVWHPRAPDMQATAGGAFDIPAAGLSQHFTVAVEAKAAQAFKKAATP